MGFTVAMVTFRIPADLNSFGVPVLRLEVCLLRGVFQCYCYILGIRSPVCHYYTVSLFGDGMRAGFSVILTQSPVSLWFWQSELGVFSDHIPLQR